MKRITDVYCYYTGGGIYVYSARYGNVYLYGTLDMDISCYKKRGEILCKDEELCKEFGWTDELNAFLATEDEDNYLDQRLDENYISPDEIEYPTWRAILRSVQKPGFYGYGTVDIEETLRYWNPDLSKRTNE